MQSTRTRSNRCFIRVLSKDFFNAKYNNSLSISTSKYQMVSTLLNASPQAKLTAAGNEVGIITMSLDTTYLNMQ
jgi:hypothetical protein